MSRLQRLKRLEKKVAKLKPIDKVFTVYQLSDQGYLFTNPNQNRSMLNRARKHLHRRYTSKGRKIPENEQIRLIVNDIDYIQGNEITIEQIKEIRGIK